MPTATQLEEPPVTTHRLAIIGGDGIGPEVVAQGLRVLDALEARHGFTTERVDYDLGGRRYLDPGEPEERNIYEAMEAGKLVKKLPMSLGDALAALDKDEVVKAAMPDDVTTAPAPPISHFIISMPAGGFREIPPESNVTPLPTKATGDSSFLPPLCSRIIR